MRVSGFGCHPLPLPSGDSYTSIYECTHMYTNKCIYIYIHTYKYVYMYIYKIHKYIYAWSRSYTPFSREKRLAAPPSHAEGIPAARISDFSAARFTSMACHRKGLFTCI
jgi:hypothetical protein